MALQYISLVNVVNTTKQITDTTRTDVAEHAWAQVSDTNLVAGNIKKDVSILGITGTLDNISTVTEVPTTKTTSIIYNSTDGKYYIWRD